MQRFTGSTTLVEGMGATGFDFVMFDSERVGNDARAMDRRRPIDRPAFGASWINRLPRREFRGAGCALDSLSLSERHPHPHPLLKLKGEGDQFQ
jgi:hypothetical protein